MRKIVLLLMFLVMGIMVACGNDGQSSQQDIELPALLEVDLRLPEEKLEPGVEVLLEAYVSQGGEAVEDANYVRFETLKQGDEQSVQIDGEHQGDGIYTANMEFADEGVYSITAHVTARDMHNMPTKELVIGDPVQTDDEQAESDHEDEEH
ncbi:FixH family protein [Bacillus sp. B15-48]|uniref:FixH family protein n=1 Tax=Bacillus sp. B15-48 TaxID=1548601 RepID=UPI00193FCA66|nr:FixH family protein [Bacillus sp. B15-48]MBM4765058.1 hypothetical protein [Bacillus sp. B15-48]